MSDFHILYTADHDYFPHMITSIYSLVENNKHLKLNIHIIGNKFTKNDFQKLDLLSELYENINIKNYTMEKISELMKLFNIPKWRGTDIANARLFFDELINDAENILYLDSDTIVVNKLDNLLNKKLNNPIAAAKEIEIPAHFQELNKLCYNNPRNPYYNSGVLLINYDLWNQEECLDELYKITNKVRKKLIYPDQDLINLAFQERIDTLDFCYNVNPLAKELENHKLLAYKFLKDRPLFYSYDEVMSSLKEPCILHGFRYLNTTAWEKNRIHPFRFEYSKYREMWDNNFEPPIKKESKIYQIPLVSDIDFFSRTLFKKETHNKIKQKVIRK